MFCIDELPLRTENNNNSGTITKKSISSYAISKGTKYYCSCRTYEQAYYVKSELNKCNWNKNKLPVIFKNYPIFYTKLLGLYRYITQRKNNRWVLTIPVKKSDNGLLQHITSTKVECLLFERDFLVEHDWDYDLLVETIDDTDNPYFNHILPPYPERKIRNNRFRNPHTKEFKWFQELLLENPERTQQEIVKITGISDMTIRNWLSTYNMTWSEFRNLVFSGEKNIFNVMKLEPLIFQPDLRPHKSHFKGYIHKDNHNKDRPYSIVYKNKRYGSYTSRNIAEKIRDDLIKCNWDRNQLPEICKRHNVKRRKIVNNIYPVKSGKYCIRKTIDGNAYYFGSYDTIDLAEMVRDELKKEDWNKSKLKKIVEKCNYLYNLI